MAGYGAHPAMNLGQANFTQLQRMTEGSTGMYNIMKAMKSEGTLGEMPSQLGAKKIGNSYGLPPGIGEYMQYESNYGPEGLLRSIANGAYVPGKFDSQHPQDLGGDPKYALMASRL